MQVGVDRRAGHVGRPQGPCLAELVVAGRLIPGTEHPRGGRRRLAAGDLGQPAEGIGRRRARDEAKAEVRRLGLDAPGGGVRASQPEVAGLVVAEQHPVAGGGEEPRNREVGRVVARMPPLGRDDRPDQRPVGGRVGTIRDVVLDLVSALIDRVGALAEAEVALTRPRVEANAHRGDARRRARDGRRQVDHTLAVRLEPDLDPPRRIRGLELGDVGTTLHAAGDDASGVEPSRGCAEAERAGRPGAEPAVLAEDGVAGSVRDRQVPGIRLDPGVQLSRGDIPESRGGRKDEKGECQPGGEPDARAGTPSRGEPQPPATAGRIVTSSPSFTAVSRPSWKRMSSPET